MMNEQIRRHNNEQAYNDASQQKKDHRQLHQTDISRRKEAYVKEIKMLYMETQNEMSNILTRLSDKKPTTEMQVVRPTIEIYVV